MARLNVSLPDDLYQTANRWRGTLNLSEICARALREEFAAVEDARSAWPLLQASRPPSRIELELVSYFGLAEALVTDTEPTPGARREGLGQVASAYLNRNLCDGAYLAVAGGRQMWCVVRNMLPRRVRVAITALGFQQNDPRVLHAHSNTLTTLLWLLFTPTADAHLVGSREFASLWGPALPPSPHPRYFVLSSCAQFDPKSPFAALLGDSACRALISQGTIGDFAYQFLTPDLEPVDLPSPVASASRFSATYLHDLSRRPDARVIAVAGGVKKQQILLSSLRARLFNVLITDQFTADYLLGTKDHEPTSRCM